MNPVIINDATMYVFVKIQMPTTADGVLYLFDADNEWCVVSEDAENVVYAYGNNEMTVLSPGERTTALTDQMIMWSITNAEYAAIGDIHHDYWICNSRH